MSLLARRKFLFIGAAALAATSVALVAEPAASAAETATIRWNAKTKSWPARPAAAQFGVVFLSTNDASAPAPRDRHKMVGDVWRRHPDAVAA
jgi:hypothetical protein